MGFRGGACTHPFARGRPIPLPHEQTLERPRLRLAPRSWGSGSGSGKSAVAWVHRARCRSRPNLRRLGTGLHPITPEAPATVGRSSAVEGGAVTKWAVAGTPRPRGGGGSQSLGAGRRDMVSAVTGMPRRGILGRQHLRGRLHRLRQKGCIGSGCPGRRGGGSIATDPQPASGCPWQEQETTVPR